MKSFHQKFADRIDERPARQNWHSKAFWEDFKHCPNGVIKQYKSSSHFFFACTHSHVSHTPGLTQLLLFTPRATICVKYQLQIKMGVKMKASVLTDVRLAHQPQGFRRILWCCWFILRSQCVLASALIDLGLLLLSESSWDIEVSEVLFPSLSSATGTDTPSTQKVRAQRKSKFSTGNYNTVIPFMCAHLINTIILTWF